MAISQEQLDAMVQAGNNAVPQQQDMSNPTTGDTGNPPWLQAMLDAAPKPDESAALLGHSTGLIDQSKVFQTPLHNIASGNGQDSIDSAIGAGKQLLSDASKAGAQNAGPVGQDMLNHAPAFKQNIESFNQQMQPTNTSQAVGGGMTSLAETVLPVGAGVDVARSSGLLNKIGQMTGISKFLSERAANKATQALQSTAETMTKGERLSAIAEGRLKPTLTGGGKYVASNTEKNAGNIMSGRLESNPVKNVSLVQNEIAIRGKEAETFLEQNAKPISNAEDFNAFKAKRDEMAKYSTDAEMKAYDAQVNIFSKQLLGRGGNNTANYYKALKEYETNVTSRLPKGKEALLSETGSAKLQAAKDVRTVVRDMIGEKHPEFKPKMFDLASLYDAFGNVSSKADAVGTFAKRHPLITKGLQWSGAGAAGALGAGGVYEGGKRLLNE